MMTTTSTANNKFNLKSIMKMAWVFVKNNGLSMSLALKKAWANARLKAKMATGIARFAFEKVDGTIREAWGTLATNIVPATNGNRRENPTLQTYFDTEKGAWRCYKVANILWVA